MLIATGELENNSAQQKELVLAVNERQASIAKTRELLLTFEARIVEFQSNVDILRVRQSIANIDRSVKNVTDYLRDFRRQVFVAEAMIEIMQ